MTPTPEVCAVHVHAALAPTAPPDVVIALHGERIAVTAATLLPDGAAVLATRTDLQRLLDAIDADETTAARQAAATLTDRAQLHSTA